MSKKRHRINGKIVVISISGVFLLLIILYLAASYYFTSHFFFRTKINGWRVGGMSLEEAEEKVGNSAKDYLLTVYDRDGEKYHIYGEDISCSYVPDGSIEKMLQAQNPLEWIIAVFSPRTNEAKITMTYQEDLISDAVADLDCFKKKNIIEPENARIETGEDGYYIEPEKQGNHMDFDSVLSKIKQALSMGEDSITLTDEDYIHPGVTSETPIIADTMEQINQYLNATVTYEIKDYEEVLDSEQIRKFIELEEDYSITLKENEIEKYVQGLASKYNTYADVRSFKTSSGDNVDIGGGDYGWIIDKPAEAKQIIEDLKNGQPVSREPIYSQRAFVEGKDDIGDTYIEIDYTKQHLWYYEKGELITETDVVTGNINRNNGSPDGVFKIVYKASPAVLKGEDYESDVTYFMPFAYNVGIHDASWRNGKFGGEIYKSSGSHGCVNAPLEIAELLYEKVSVGTPVIAYYREEVELTAENAKLSNAFSYIEPEKETEDGQTTNP